MEVWTGSNETKVGQKCRCGVFATAREGQKPTFTPFTEGASTNIYRTNMPSVVTYDEVHKNQPCFLGTCWEYEMIR